MSLLANAGDASKIKADEHIVFFTSVAHLDAEKNEWVIPIHGWIYEPEKSVIRKAAIAKFFKETYGLLVDESSKSNFDRRVNLLLCDNERGKRISIHLLGENYLLEKSSANGHFEDVVRVPVDSVACDSTDGVLEFSVNLEEGDTRVFRGRVHCWKATGLTILSDIDDTVKVSHVGDKKRLFEHTFFRDFEVIPGMAEKYRDWAEKGAAIHFVSSSPWHLYDPLYEFFESSGFPASTASLKSIRLKDRTILNLLKKGMKTKPIPIESLLNRFPERQFILIGDDGEEDPEVYAEIYKKYRHQIKSIYIRNVSGAMLTDDRFTDVFSEVPEGVWHLFSQPNEIEVGER